MPTVTSPSTTARAVLRGILETEFALEGYPVSDDRLHASIGREGTKIATSPIREIPLNRQDLALTCEILVQFYGRWKDEINNTTSVNPATIEGYAERFRRALLHHDPHTDHVWYFNLTEILYPPDPTDNITRFEAHVTAIGNNSALIETTG